MNTKFYQCVAAVECSVIPLEEKEFYNVSQMIESNQASPLLMSIPAATFICPDGYPTDEELARCNLKGEYFLLITVKKCNILDAHGKTVSTRILDTYYKIVTPF